jgi:hypothetical protein
MFHISPTSKEKPQDSVNQKDPVTLWTIQYNFRFPQALSIHTKDDTIDNTRYRMIHEVPPQNSSLYFLLSQYNPWLDCEMTREKRAYLKPRSGEICFPVYSNSNLDGSKLSSNFFRNETIIDTVNLYLWPLLHTRADEVISCKTFRDWQRLFKNTISIAFPDYEYWVSVASGGGGGAPGTTSAAFIPISDQRRTARILKYVTPARVLYLLTTRANFWPYGQYSVLSSASTSSASSSSFIQRESSVSSTRQRQGGLCVVKPKIKEYTEKTQIEWLVTAEFLRKMKRVHMYFTNNLTYSDTSFVFDSDSE